MPVTASEINRAIRAKYSDRQWRVWFEVSQSTGYNSGRRADAVVMNIWPSQDYQLHVFEVKTSRADFKNEIADLSKWQAVGQYADFFWLACPLGLIKPDEVPEAWGLMELTKAGLRIKKQAPVRSDPLPIDRAFAASLLRAGQDLTQAEIDRRVHEAIEVERQSIYEAAQLKAGTENTRLKMRVEKVEAWKRDFESVFGCVANVHSLPADMAARVKLATKIERNQFDGLARQAKALAGLIEEISRTR